MPIQIVTITANNDDGYQNTATWSATPPTAIFIFGGGNPENGGWSFPLTTRIPPGAKILKAYFRVFNDGALDGGTSTINLQTEEVNPAAAVIWSTGHLPGNAVALRARNVGPVTWANGFYFGEGDLNQQNIAQDIQDLVNAGGGIEVGERVNIFIEDVGAAGGFPAFVDSSVGANDPQLTIVWVEQTGGLVSPAPEIQDNDEDDFLAELRTGALDNDWIIEKWFDEDLEPAAAAGNDMVASGSLSITGAADLDATGTLVAAGAVSIIGAADLDAVGSLVAAGAISITGAADLDAIGQLLAAGSIFITGAADLTSPANDDIAAAGSLSITGDADLDALGDLLAAGAISISGIADLTEADDNDIDASGTLVITGLASLTALGALVAAGSIVINGVADLTGGAAPAASNDDWLLRIRRHDRRS